MLREETVPNVRRIPGSNAKKWAKFHLKYAATSTYEPDFVWDRNAPAIGPFCTDVDGNVIIDFASHVASAPFGYNNPEIVDLLSRIKQNDPDRYAGSDFIAGYGKNPSSLEIPTPSHLHHKIYEITKHLKMDIAYFSNTGTEAVENAIKVCYNYKKNFGYGINFSGAFHGRTLGSLSLNRSKSAHRSYYPQISNIMTFPFCSCKEECRCGWMEQNISKLRKSLDPKRGIIKQQEVSYLIIEPIQGEGGYNIPNVEFMKEIQRIVQENNISLICDEVQTGIARSGKWWACEHFGMKPDVIAAGKALRIGATIGKKKMFPNENGRISSTWGEGNAIASAVGYKTIEIIQKKNLLENARKMGNYFVQRLNELKDKFSFITDVGGIGLLDKMDIDTQERRNKILDIAFKKGLLLVSCGYSTIRFLPPLDIQKREKDIALENLEDALKRTR